MNKVYPALATWLLALVCRLGIGHIQAKTASRCCKRDFWHTQYVLQPGSCCGRLDVHSSLHRNRMLSGQVCCEAQFSPSDQALSGSICLTSGTTAVTVRRVWAHPCLETTPGSGSWVDAKRTCLGTRPSGGSHQEVVHTSFFCSSERGLDSFYCRFCSVVSRDVFACRGRQELWWQVRQGVVEKKRNPNR